MYSDASPSAICVQQFDDSLDPAIHTTYRISLRSSSLREPRDPSLMTVWFLESHCALKAVVMIQVDTQTVTLACQPKPLGVLISSNDPIAGSPTMTLLRLLLPLNDEIQATSVMFSSSEPFSNTTSEDFIASFNR